MNNLTQLIAQRAEKYPAHKYGMIGTTQTLSDLTKSAARVAASLRELGLKSGSRVALIGINHNSYLVAWTALQFAGCQAALINPSYPPELLAEMLLNLEPDAVVWVGVPPNTTVCPGVVHIDASQASDRLLRVNGCAIDVPREAMSLPGLDRKHGDVAGFMHTSGTTGTPKFCAQSHEYFIRLGRFIADSLAFCEDDTVFAPLPLFHINPLGYGVIGALTGMAQFRSTEKFSASRFWSEVKSESVTALILHAPPVEILKRATTPADSKGHAVRIVFYADREFLEDYQIPLGVSAYGSTEAGGLSHVWMWRRGDDTVIPEGLSRYGGRGRHDIEWRVSADGEIELRPVRQHVMFEGYQRGKVLNTPFAKDGWFATGDLGRIDEAGNLVFIERQAESIRVKGEFVPIGYVEDAFSKIDGIDDVAIWRRPSELVDDEITLYVVSNEVDLNKVGVVRSSLPSFMRPTSLIRVDHIPRDAGVGKIRRRQLGEARIIEEHSL